MRCGKKSNQGFTLIELLIVIAIIALLMSILMPAVRKIKDQAKMIVCRSNLRQVSLIFYEYTNDFRGSFHHGRDDDWANNGLKENPGAWMWPTRDYHKGDFEIFCCPVASKKPDPLPTSDCGGSTRSMWYFGENQDYWRKNTYGSYGFNTWLTNPAPGKEDNYAHADVGSTRLNWRNINQNGAYEIPLMASCLWYDGWPKHSDAPPDYEGEPGDLEYMKWFCLNRHDRNNGLTNVAFLDCSVRKTGLKEMWELKWHRYWYRHGNAKKTPDYNPPSWSEWMEDFKDFDRFQ